MGTKVTLAVADGTNMGAFVACPVATPRPLPGLIVLQEAFGVNKNTREIAERLSAEGFLCIAPELFHRTAPGKEFPYDFEAVKPHYMAITTPGLEADLRAAFLWLQNEGVKSIGAIGFCLGGRAAYVANAILPLKAAVSFYGGGIAGELLERAKDQRGPILFFWGGKDAHITPEVRKPLFEALGAAEKPYVNVEFSAANHAFFNNDRPSYEPASAAQAFALAKAFLKSNLA